MLGAASARVVIESDRPRTMLKANACFLILILSSPEFFRTCGQSPRPRANTNISQMKHRRCGHYVQPCARISCKGSWVSAAPRLEWNEAVDDQIAGPYLRSTDYLCAIARKL